VHYRSGPRGAAAIRRCALPPDLGDGFDDEAELCHLLLVCQDISLIDAQRGGREIERARSLKNCTRNFSSARLTPTS
jgi:hypothetical protein